MVEGNHMMQGITDKYRESLDNLGQKLDRMDALLIHHARGYLVSTPNETKVNWTRFGRIEVTDLERSQ